MNNAAIYQLILHELKNSITFAGSSLQLVEKEHPQLRLLEHWNDAMKEFSHLENLTRELAKPYPFEALRFEPLCVTEFLLSAVKPFQNKTENSHLHITLHCPKDPVTIEADAMYLKLVLTNLLKNADEAITGEGCIDITATLSDRGVSIEIADNGPGIPAQNAEDVFQAFYTTKETGTGLGLFLCHDIITKHQGTLSLRQNLPHGCIFTIDLPMTIQK